jgi:hypothetical protein
MVSILMTEPSCVKAAVRHLVIGLGPLLQPKVSQEIHKSAIKDFEVGLAECVEDVYNFWSVKLATMANVMWDTQYSEDAVTLATIMFDLPAAKSSKSNLVKNLVTTQKPMPTIEVLLMCRLSLKYCAYLSLSAVGNEGVDGRGSRFRRESN